MARMAIGQFPTATLVVASILPLWFPIFEKTVISAFACRNRSFGGRHCRRVGVRGMFVARNILYLRYKPA